MLKDAISKISQEFINEALASPKLVADMAAMETYMAESYNGRTFVELLQNADDCRSTSICFQKIGMDIIFANNGRPFNEKDVSSICRSGASNKKRGENIGYRGVGFKSTKYLTDEIVIYSDNTYFTFNKKLCSKKTGIPVDNLPVIRIPIIIEQVDPAIGEAVSKFIKEGFTTVFIFKNAKIESFLDEVKQIENDAFIFLHYVEKCRFIFPEYKKEYHIHRVKKTEGKAVYIDGESNYWYVRNMYNTAVALKCDTTTNRIIACNEKEQVYHSFLPTLDKMCIPMKVNADFSTDPSRKHIVLDDETKKSIDSIAHNMLSIIIDALALKTMDVLLGDLFTILNSPSTFSRLNSQLTAALKSYVLRDMMLTLQNGQMQSIVDYKLLPEWLDNSEKLFIRQESKYIMQYSTRDKVYATYKDIDVFFSHYTNERFNSCDLTKMLSEEQFVKKCR